MSMLNNQTYNELNARNKLKEHQQPVPVASQLTLVSV